MIGESSPQMLYVELNAAGESRHCRHACAPRPLGRWSLRSLEVATIRRGQRPLWITRANFEAKAASPCHATIVPAHIADVRGERSSASTRRRLQLSDRLTKEINYWDHRAEELRLQERAGRAPARLELPREARKRADALQSRLRSASRELRLERQLSPLPPVVPGGLLVVPAGLLVAMGGQPTTAVAPDTRRSLHAPEPRSWRSSAASDSILSTGRPTSSVRHRAVLPGTGKLRFIEVKGRVTGADTITVTRNEILLLAQQARRLHPGIVEFHDGDHHTVHYLRRPFQREPDFGVTSVNYDFAELLARAETPR